MTAQPDDPADAVLRFFQAVDDQDWTAVRQGLGDDLVIDYSSLFGGGPESLTADVLVERWRALLPGFDATQHFLGPLLVAQRSPDAVAVSCNVRGYHWLDRSEWVVAGRYSLELTRRDDRWTLVRIVLLAVNQSGDSSLAERATQRAAAG